MLTRERILQANDIKEEVVDVPEWGDSVKIRGFSLAQRLNILRLCQTEGTVDNVRFVTLTFIEGVVEPKLDKGDYLELSKKSNAAITRVNDRIFALSGINAGAVEEARKNSEATQSDNSSTN